MAKSLLVEHVLALVVGRSRASEVVGDLLEQYSFGSYLFWWNFAGVIFCALWRWGLGITLAATFTVVLLVRYALLLPVQGTGGVAMPPGMHYLLTTVCLGTALLLNVCRYGLRDKANGTGLAFTLLLMGCSTLPWFPVLAYIAPAMTFLGLLLALIWRTSRRAALCLLVPALAYAGVFRVGIELVGIEHIQPNLLFLQVVGVWMVSYLAAARILAEVRGHLLPELLHV